ncbi:carboxypeptidase-like regulatory domain-containing protein [Cerasicoccus maritimus]|uniref:carboxypeptidase-like regulatory domain-containing protein n=1 Tax=Cerasicoccus maritimus TaxID=490089 RepID=UPI00285260CC|nr:carboxypeptidase-like regulatory domain-containing protein [Cerasicoccus maritimus]
MRPFLFALTLTALFLSGCIIPHRYTVAPPVSGIVIEEATGEPIAGAKVIVRSQAESGIFHKQFQTTTNSDGRFEIPPQKVTWIYIVPQEAYYPRAVLTVTAEGFDQFQEFDLGFPSSPRHKEAEATNPSTGWYDFSYLDGITVRLKESVAQKP